MSLLDRLRGRSRTTSYTAEAITLHAGHLLEVVGESHRQDALRRIAATASDCSPYARASQGGLVHSRTMTATAAVGFALLICEENNPVDPNAIAVYADGVGLVGYLNRDDAIDDQPVGFSAPPSQPRASGCSLRRRISSATVRPDERIAGRHDRL